MLQPFRDLQLEASTQLLISLGEGAIDIDTWRQRLQLPLLRLVNRGDYFWQKGKQVMADKGYLLLDIARQPETALASQITCLVDKLYQQKEEFATLLVNNHRTAQVRTTLWFAPEPTPIKSLEKDWAYMPFDLSADLVKKMSEMQLSFTVDMQVKTSN